MDQKKSKSQTPPFEPSKKPAGGGAIAGKYGLSYSRVKHLAKMGMKKQTKEVNEAESHTSLTKYANIHAKEAEMSQHPKAKAHHQSASTYYSKAAEAAKKGKEDHAEYYQSKAEEHADTAEEYERSESVNELSNELLQRYKKEAGKQVDNPSTPSSMKYKRGLGHLMATVKQMKSGKPMPKESVQEEETTMDEMSKGQMKKREDIVKSMKKNFSDFRKRYGEKAKSVMYATATKQAMKEEEEGEHLCAKHVYSQIFGEGVVLEGEHAEPDADGNIEWYMVEFAEGVKKVYTEKLKVMHAEMHGNHKKKKMSEMSSKEKMKRGLYNKEEVKEDTHYCAKHVYSELFGEGIVMHAQHAEPDAEGNIEWYMVEFVDGIRKVQTEDIEIMVAEYHMNHKKKMKDEEVEFEAPSSIKKEGLPHFMGAAAAAHKAGKKEFSFGGKTYPVTIKKHVAGQIK